VLPGTDGAPDPDAADEPDLDEPENGSHGEQIASKRVDPEPR
jgi:hypothetical protein